MAMVPLADETAHRQLDRLIDEHVRYCLNWVYPVPSAAGSNTANPWLHGSLTKTLTRSLAFGNDECLTRALVRRPAHFR